MSRHIHAGPAAINGGSVSFRLRVPTSILMVAAALFSVLTFATPASAQPAPSVEVTHYCFADNGRFDATVAVPDGGQMTSFVIRLTGLAPRQIVLPPGFERTVSFTGRLDAPDYVLTVDAAGVEVERYEAAVSCDPEVTVNARCLAGNGLITATVVNRSDAAMIYSASITGLAERSVVVGPRESGRIATSGRPDKEHSVVVRRGTQAVFNETVVVDCDPDLPGPPPEPVFSLPDLADASETVLHVNCVAGKGRFDLDVVAPRGDEFDRFLLVQVSTGGVSRHTAMSQGSRFRATITGRNNGVHNIRVRASNDEIFNRDVTVDC